MSAVAVVSSGLGTATGMFTLKEDLKAMLQSEDFLTDVAKRKGLVANMDKPATHLVDAAVKMGAKIVSVSATKSPVFDEKRIDKI